MDLAFGNRQGDSGEGFPVLVEDQRGLPVEFSLLDFEFGATGRRGDEGGHVRRALERPTKVLIGSREGPAPRVIEFDGATDGPASRWRST